MVNLHTHSMFSLRDSIIRPEDFVERLQEIRQNAVALSDPESQWHPLYSRL